METFPDGLNQSSSLVLVSFKRAHAQSHLILYKRKVLKMLLIESCSLHLLKSFQQIHFGGRYSVLLLDLEEFVFGNTHGRALRVLVPGLEVMVYPWEWRLEDRNI